MLDTMRAFLAANLELRATRSAAEFARIARHSASAPEASWSPPTKLHVTLRFLGDIDIGLAPALSDALRARIAGRPAPRIHVGAIGAFPEVVSAKAIFLAIGDPHGDLAKLHESITTIVDDLGFAPDERPFVPHLTIARCSRSCDLRPWLAGISTPLVGAARLREVALYRSDLPRSGAEYATLEKVGLELSSG